MKKLATILKLLAIFAVALITVSCHDFMETDNNRYLLSNQSSINSVNDTAYSLVGILTKMQKVAEKYVIDGELRADLLDVTAKSDADLQKISNFSADTTNAYASSKEFYAIVNNCNYFLQKVDTNVLSSSGSKPFLTEYYAVKTIRAWAYLQIALNYGKIKYTDKPILSLSEVNNYTEYNLRQAIDVLTADMLKIFDGRNIAMPYYSFLGSDASQLFIEPRVLLGDLLLWRGSFSHSQYDYETAAIFYASAISKRELTVGFRSQNYYNNKFTISGGSYFSNFLPGYDFEQVSKIILSTSSASGITWTLPTLCLDSKLTYSNVLDSISKSQYYCYQPDYQSTTASPPKYIKGDLRLQSVLRKYSLLKGVDEAALAEDPYIITMFSYGLCNVYRGALIYLRFAEALNRMGKPGVAFGILKYGINAINLSNPLYFPASELADQKSYITMFVSQNETFKRNEGLHNCGSGESTNNSYYVLPTCSNQQDSILAVEDKICDELALEMFFEGNRFHDLMRFSNHRSDPTFLAHKVALKHYKHNGTYNTSEYNKYFTLLSNPDNWYLPLKKN